MASTQTVALADRRSPKRSETLAAENVFSFQLSLWQLLAKQVMLYTMGESSSISQYDAHRLLTATCCVLGVDPDDPDAAILQALTAEGVERAYGVRLKRLEEATRNTEALWTEVCLTVPLLDSLALKDTLKSLKSFSARYQPRFFAHEIPADIDYPLSFPVNEGGPGVDYVATYLKRLLLENRFINCFDLDACRGLLRAVHPSYGELILNLFDPVITNALGLALAGQKVRELRVGETQQQLIEGALQGLSAKRQKAKMIAAAGMVCSGLGLKDEVLCAYVEQAAASLSPRVHSALRTDGLAGVFLTW